MNNINYEADRIAVAVIYGTLLYYNEFFSDDKLTIGEEPKADISIPDFGDDICVSWDVSEDVGIVFDEEKNKSYEVQNDIPLSLVHLQRKVSIILSKVSTDSKEVSLIGEDEFSLGRCAEAIDGQENDIIIQQPFISKFHLTLKKINGKLYAFDNNSKNGLYLNGKRIVQAEIKDNDVLSILIVRILYANNTLTIYNAGEKVSIKRRIIPSNTEDANTIIRSPRIIIDNEEKKIEIKKPPSSTGKPIVNWLTILVSPLITLLLMAFMVFFMGMNKTMLIMTGGMSVSSVLIAILTYRNQKKKFYSESENLDKQYREYLYEIKREIDAAHEKQKNYLEYNNPSPVDCAEIVKYRDSQLWERKPEDADFLSARLGTGTEKANVFATFEMTEFSSEDITSEAVAQKIAENSTVIQNCVIQYSFLYNKCTGIIGIRESEYQLVRNILMELFSMHAYDEIKIVIITDSYENEYWNWAKNIHHCHTDDRLLIYTSFEENKKDLSVIESDLLQRIPVGRSNQDKNNRQLPYYLFVITDPWIEMHPLYEIIIGEEECGVRSIFMYDDFSVLPKECTGIIEAGNKKGTVLHSENEIINQIFIPDRVSKDTVLSFAKNISAVHLDSKAQGAGLPKSISFMEMMNADTIESLHVLNRWKKSNVNKSLAAPVGVDHTGEQINLDIHETFHGPHGLVAGTTGSGKSEFLITYILSMAINYSPDEVAFALIDYKGGGLAGAFLDTKNGIMLPHLAGTITNLDGASLRRTLVSIKSELQRRQRIFAEAVSVSNEGTMDIYSYQQLFRQGKVSEPVPHLLIISDEFAELKQQEPEFISELVSAARIGRSLGVHLILATQKPAGVVTDQIRSNTKFSICLKVADVADSKDMIDKPDAAFIKNTGRFYMKIGKEDLFIMGQSAWTGAPYRAAPKTKQLVAIVKYLSEIGKRNNCVTKQLWLDALPKIIDLEGLNSGYAVIGSPYRVLIGMIDDPENQDQYPMYVDLLNCRNMAIVGESASGKTVLLKSMLFNLVSNYSPEELNYYIIDFSGRGLKSFSAIPHCGAYLDENSEDDYERFLNFTKEIVKERKALFEQEQVSTYQAYIKTAKMPLILVIIDNLYGIMSYKKGNQYYSSLHDAMHETATYGIRFIITANHYNEISMRCKQELSGKLALSLKDKYEYSEVLGAKCRFTPEEAPGRGICSLEGKTLEYQCAIIQSDLNEVDRSVYIKNKLNDILTDYGNCSAQIFPVLNLEESYEQFCIDCPSGRLPLGYVQDNVKKVFIPYARYLCCMLYFGSSSIEKIIISNLFYAFQRDGSQIVIVKRKVNSIFPDGDQNTGNSGIIYSFTCSSGESWNLTKTISEEIERRKKYRDIYCDQQQLEKSSPDSLRKAAPYISSQTKPYIVFFESFSDFCETADEQTKQVFPVICENMLGYNLQLYGCFEPDDVYKIVSNPIFASFKKEQFAVMFSGRFNKANIVPLEGKSSTITDYFDRLNRGLLNYGGKSYSIFMPCGKMEIKNEEDIFF